MLSRKINFSARVPSKDTLKLAISEGIVHFCEKNLQANSQVIRRGGSLMIKDLREKVKMYMQLYVFVDIVKKDSPSLRK